MTLAADLDKFLQFKKITIYKICGKKTVRKVAAVYKVRLPFTINFSVFHHFFILLFSIIFKKPYSQENNDLPNKQQLKETKLLMILLIFLSILFTTSIRSCHIEYEVCGLAWSKVAWTEACLIVLKL